MVKGSTMPPSPHSPVSPPSSLPTMPKRSTMVSENNNLSQNSFLPNMHFNSSSGLPLDSWLAAAAAAASSSPTALLSSASLSNFLSHSSSIYPGYLLHSNQSEAPSLMPHPIGNSPIPSIPMLSNPLSRVNSSCTSVSVSPSASPLNLSVNGSTSDTKHLQNRASLNSNSKICKDISPLNFDPRNSSIVALRLRAKEHVELINQSLTIAWNHY